MNKYPESITIDVDANMHLQYTDVPENEHTIRKVQGQFCTNPKAGRTQGSFSSFDGVEQYGIGLGIAILITILILSAGEARLYRKKRTVKGLPSPQNPLDLTDGEYEGKMYVNYSEDEYAFTVCNLEKINDVNYKATVDSLFRCNSGRIGDVIRILPADITMTDAGPGRLIGHTILNMMDKKTSIQRAFSEIAVNMKNPDRRLPMTEVFTCSMKHTIDEKHNLLFETISDMIAVDCLPTEIKFDKENRIFIG